MAWSLDLVQSNRHILPPVRFINNPTSAFCCATPLPLQGYVDELPNQHQGRQV